MPKKIEDIPVRGGIDTINAYLGSAQISSEEFVKYKPQVSKGLLGALGLHANSVPLPTEDPVSFAMNAADELLANVDTETKNEISYVEIGTESIRDGSLPMSQYILKFIDHDDIISSETKHACVAAMNAIWKNCPDTGLVVSTDIAHYNDDETTAPSAEFTAGAGSVATLTSPIGKILDILNVRGASSSLTYDFYKPYQEVGMDLMAKTYPTVFGKYSNLANIFRVGNAYENLKGKVEDLNLDTFSGIVFHIPYPGLTKYNLAYLILIDQKDRGIPEAMDTYDRMKVLFSETEYQFEQRDFDTICDVEIEVKGILKSIMKGEDGEFNKYYQKLSPSLELIQYTGNIYTGSSPLGMMSLLEHADLPPNSYILWGGYGSGNQAIFMIAKTNENTNPVVANWNTQQKLLDRRTLSAADYAKLKELATQPYSKLADMDSLQVPAKPTGLHYLSDMDKFQIKNYEKDKATNQESIIHQAQQSRT